MSGVLVLCLEQDTTLTAFLSIQVQMAATGQLYSVGNYAMDVHGIQAYSKSFYAAELGRHRNGVSDRGHLAEQTEPFTLWARKVTAASSQVDHTGPQSRSLSQSP